MAWGGLFASARVFGDTKNRANSENIVPRFSIFISPEGMNWQYIYTFHMLFRIKLQQILLLSFGILSFATNAEVIDGINYRLKALNYTPSSGINKYQATVIAPIEGMSYCGDIVIPQTIKGTDGNTYVVEATAQNAFKGQHELKSITIERDFYPTSTYILNPDKYKDGFIRATQEFKDCDKLEAINCEKKKGSTSNGGTWESWCYSINGVLMEQPLGSSSIYTYVIPSGTIKEFAFTKDGIHIRPGTFTHPDNITAITLKPNQTISTNGYSSFGAMRNLERFKLDGEHNTYTEIDGVLYSKRDGNIVQFPGKHRESYTLPASNKIPNYAFAGCSIDNLILSPEVDVWSSDAFINFHGTIHVLGEISNNLASSLSKIDSGSKIECLGRYVTTLQTKCSQEVSPLHPVWIDNLNSDYRNPKFSLAFSEDINQTAITSVSIEDRVIHPNAEGFYNIGTLCPETGYKVTITYEQNGIQHVATDFFKTSAPQQFETEIISLTPYSVKIGITCDKAISDNNSEIEIKLGDYSYENVYKTAKAIIVSPGKYEVEFTGLLPVSMYASVILKIDDNTYNANELHFAYDLNKLLELDYEATHTTVIVKGLKFNESYPDNNHVKCSLYSGENKLTNLPYTIKGLRPGEARESIFLIANRENFPESDIWSWSPKAEVFNASLKITDVGPSTIALAVDYPEGDAPVKTIHIKGDNKTFEGCKAIISGLSPETNYSFKAQITLEDSKGKYFRNASANVNTKKLELSTLQPKNVSATASIVCANTNLSRYETGSGFQWRKLDAPESLRSNEGFAAIHNGTMEGYIKNLQTTSYYKVRAFYKDSKDKYYFGDWVTFDPSDFSYFEPTVHTYGVENVSYNSVTMRGYVLRGTDDIISQGFVYYPAESSKKSFRLVSKTESSSIVLADGQLITATVSDLIPSTDYICTAFVETVSGIKYGEEVRFSTPEGSGIETIIPNEDEVKPVVYYNLQGNSNSEPFKGFNIVIYNNGTTKKVMIK